MAKSTTVDHTVVTPPNVMSKTKLRLVKKQTTNAELAVSRRILERKLDTTDDGEDLWDNVPV